MSTVKVDRTYCDFCHDSFPPDFRQHEDGGYERISLVNSYVAVVDSDLDFHANCIDNKMSARDLFTLIKEGPEFQKHKTEGW